MCNERKVAIRLTLGKRPHRSARPGQTPLPRDSIEVEGRAPEAAPNDVPAAEQYAVQLRRHVLATSQF
jgi:hypothetical protein